MNSDTRSFSDRPKWQDIIVTCYGDGETFPYRSSVTVSTEDTVAGLKDHIFNKAEEEGFSMTGIDQQSMIVCYLDDNDKKTYLYANDTKLKDLDCIPRLVFLPGYFLDFGVDQAMHHIDNVVLSPLHTDEPRPSSGVPLDVRHAETFCADLIQDLPSEIHHMIMKLLDKPSLATLARVSKYCNAIATPFIWRDYKPPYLSQERILTEADYQALRKNAHHIRDLRIPHLNLAEVFFGYRDPQLKASRPLVTCVNLKTLDISCSSLSLESDHTEFGTRNGYDLPPHIEARLPWMITKTPSLKTIWLLMNVSSDIYNDIVAAAMNRDLKIHTVATLFKPYKENLP